MIGHAFLSLTTAFGLSTAAGLNAYIPLLVVAVLGRFTPFVTLNGPWEALTSWWVIATLTVLLTIEILVDKIPAADTVNDIIQTFIRPTAGAILFASTTKAIGLHPVVAAICGVILAGGVHTVKAGGRPVISATTGGLGNPIISTLEDIISFVASVLAILMPFLLLLFILLVLALVVWWYVRRRRKKHGYR